MFIASSRMVVSLYQYILHLKIFFVGYLRNYIKSVLRAIIVWYLRQVKVSVQNKRMVALVIQEAEFGHHGSNRIGLSGKFQSLRSAKLD